MDNNPQLPFEIRADEEPNEVTYAAMEAAENGYSQSESILTIRMWLREYEVFVNEGSELEALDSLLQAVRDYPTLLNYATQWNAQDEVSLAFQDILNILSQKYQLSQEEAQQIADISDNVEYTKNVMLVLCLIGYPSFGKHCFASQRCRKNMFTFIIG